MDPQGVTSSLPEMESALAAAPVVDAWREVSLAADRSGVSIRTLASVDDMRASVRLYDSIWRPTDGASIMNVELLQALASVESYVAAAFEGETMLAACAAMWGPPGSGTLHSHIAGVADSARGRDLGYALKLHQRAWALGHGLDKITWTFDPLVRRNAHFNITKLGGSVRTYYVNHYGSMLDDINGEDESDRLKLEWDLTPAASHALTPPDQSSTQAARVLWPNAHNRPETSSSTSSTVLVGIPEDIEAIRRSDPELGAEWRMAARQVLSALLTTGGRIDAFDRERGAYVVTRGSAR